MALNDVIFNLGQGGLGRQLAGNDFISGFLVFNNTLPSGFSSSNRVNKVNSVADAIALGIDKDYSDETRATATYLFTAVGADGDTIELKFAEPRGSVSLGVYTKVTADSTVTLLGASYAATINAGTSTHGYSAVAASGTVTITVRKGLGVFPNTGTPFSAIIVGAITGTLVQNVIAGVYSKRAIYYYQISEFFRLQPSGVLYIGVYGVPSTYNFIELQNLVNFATGNIRQAMIYVDNVAFTTAHITAIQAVCDTVAIDHKPLSVLLGGDISATAAVTSLTDISILDSEKVSVIIFQDGAGFGWDLWKSTGKSITAIGAVLGAVALAKVSEDIAWVSKFNLSDGAELDTINFANGQTLVSQSTSTQNQLNNYRYIFARQFVGLSGSYLNDSNVATLLNSDYAYIENNRTIDKAIRNLRVSYLPSLNAPLTLNSDGTLSNATIAFLTGIGNSTLDQMVRDLELSNYSVLINPAQNVLSTSQVVITVSLLINGVARNIVINIGFAASI